ncbi:hypothetical protein JTB14_009452 [Gonioctena quinquepunctata]|nr:hypothetical protein JTB14_009452 [Gonioctena quinquepunctata]
MVLWAKNVYVPKSSNFTSHAKFLLRFPKDVSMSSLSRKCQHAIVNEPPIDSFSPSKPSFAEWGKVQAEVNGPWTGNSNYLTSEGTPIARADSHEIDEDFDIEKSMFRGKKR